MAVEIPTSRYIDRVSANSGRSLVRLPQVDPGRATQELGRAVQGLGQNIAQIAEKNSAEIEQKRSYDVQVNAERFRQQEEQAFLEASNTASGSGIGFTRSFIEGHQKRTNEWVEANLTGVDPQTDASLRKSLLGFGGTLFKKAEAFETRAKTSYYDANTNESLDGVRRQIRANSSPFEDLREQGTRIIDAADMPNTWKEARKREWAADAAESKWQFAYESDPEGAVEALRGGGERVSSPILAKGITDAANALGVSPVDLATAISYETGGTFNPSQKGPRTQWGRHKGLIQFGEPQAAKYGVDWENPAGSQLGADGAIVKYLRDAGVQPGMGMLDIYSAINAGSVGKYDASDANNGGAPGTVRDKVEKQMAGHRKKAIALLGGDAAPGEYDDIPYDRQQKLIAAGERGLVAQEKEKTFEITKDGYDLIAQGEMNQEWFDLHKDELNISDYKVFSRALVPGGQAKATDPKEYVRLLDLADSEPERAIEEVKSAYSSGAVAKDVFNRVFSRANGNLSEENRKPAYQRELRSYVNRVIAPERDASREAHARHLDAMFAYDDWVASHPDATREEIRRFSEDLVRDTKAHTGAQVKARLPLPTNIDVPRESINMDALERARARVVLRLKLNGISKSEAAEQQRIIERWMGAIGDGTNGR